jgi:hypothetical protein
VLSSIAFEFDEEEFERLAMVGREQRVEWLHTSVASTVFCANGIR